MTAAILAILESQAKLIAVLIGSQTPDQQKVMWDRYLELTEPLHRLLIKIENLGAPSGNPPSAASK